MLEDNFSEISNQKPAPKKSKPKTVKKVKKPADNPFSAPFSFKPSAPTGSVKKTKASKKKSSSLSKVVFTFIILTGILLIVVGYFTFARVLITILPSQERVSSNLTMDIYDSSKSQTAPPASIIGVVKLVPVELSQSFQVTGKEILGQEVTGKVTIINNYTKSQPLVATTRLLSTDNKLFRIKDTVNVPAGGQIEVSVYADQPSAEMAVGPTRFTIPGLWAGLQDQIYGQSSEAMKYSQKAKTRIEQSDIDNAVKSLREQLLARAKEQIGTAYKNYAKVLYEIDNNLISQELDSKIGEEKESFNLNMKAQVAVIAFSDDKIFENARQKLAAALADDKELVQFEKKDINYNLASFNIDQGLATINLSFAGKAVLKEDSKLIDKNNLLGLTKQQLSDYLKAMPEISGYEIKFYPSFIEKVPNLIDRIKIEIKK